MYCTVYYWMLLVIVIVHVKERWTKLYTAFCDNHFKKYVSCYRSVMPLCGAKVSMCCTVVSAWGLIQLGLTGVFFYIGSPALVEDIPFNEQ